MTALIIVGAIVLVILLWFFGTYNGLVSLRNKKDDQWSQIEVQLKRRADLIPNLVETVKGYAKHEKETFEDVIKARNTYVAAKTPEDEMKASGAVTEALRSPRNPDYRNIPAYIREVRRLQKKYEDQIEVYLGLEYDGYTKLENRELYDYVLGDCHYIKIGNEYFSVDHAKDEQWATIEKYFGGDAIAYSKAYFDTYVERTRINKPDILGHYDLSAKFGHVDETSPVYRNMATEALIAALEVTPIIELNTGAISRGIRAVPYPADYLLKEVLAHNGKVVLCSDSHDMKNLDAYFDESVELLKSLGFKSIVQLHKNKFEEVGI